jgi:predicted DNA-binding protein
VCMSMLERRLQLLLTEEQHARLAQEASRSGRSVNAVIREAIDRQHPDEASLRAAALERWLDLTELRTSTDSMPTPGAAQLKAEYDQEENDHMDAILRG